MWLPANSISNHQTTLFHLLSISPGSRIEFWKSPWLQVSSGLDNAELFPMTLNSCIWDMDPFHMCPIISTGYQLPITIDIDGVDRMQLITLHEIMMLAFMNQLTDKPDLDKSEHSAYLVDYCQLSCTMLHRFSILPYCEMESQAQPASFSVSVSPSASKEGSGMLKAKW